MDDLFYVNFISVKIFFKKGTKKNKNKLKGTKNILPVTITLLIP